MQLRGLIAPGLLVLLLLVAACSKPLATIPAVMKSEVPGGPRGGADSPGRGTVPADRGSGAAGMPALHGRAGSSSPGAGSLAGPGGPGSPPGSAVGPGRPGSAPGGAVGSGSPAPGGPGGPDDAAAPGSQLAAVAPSESMVPAAPEGVAARPSPREFVSVPGLKDIYFDFDRAEISPAATKILEENARWLKANPGHLVLVEGHCDERGTGEYNLALGDRRAKAAMTFLVSLGIRAERMTTISYGEEHPACAEKTDGCWAKNRRAHFLVKAG